MRKPRQKSSSKVEPAVAEMGAEAEGSVVSFESTGISILTALNVLNAPADLVAKESAAAGDWSAGSWSTMKSLPFKLGAFGNHELRRQCVVTTAARGHCCWQLENSHVPFDCGPSEWYQVGAVHRPVGWGKAAAASRLKQQSYGAP
jgi:hypothetical protein